MPVRLFVSGRASDELDALRSRLAADANLQLVDRIELADAVVSLPRLRSPDQDELRRSRLGSLSRRDSLSRRSAEREVGREVELIEELTGREHQVLTLAADGRSNRDIASALAISEHTVKFHLASIFGKLGVSTRTEAVHRGIRLGILEI